MKRILKYKLSQIDYIKLKKKNYNNIYYNKNRNILRANYILHMYGTKIFVKFLKRKTDRNFTRILTQQFPKVYEELSKFINPADSSQINNYINDVIKYCKECGIIIHKGTFCSVKCSNSNKLSSDTYSSNLSKGQKLYYEHASLADLKVRKNNIRKGTANFLENETNEEKQIRLSKNKHDKFAYESFKEKYSELFQVNCADDFFYSNRDIPVSCNKCRNKWFVTKTTSYSRIICRQCNPYDKHKQQNEISEFIRQSTDYVMDNDRTVICPKEIDITSQNFGIEFNGLLSHSYGKSNLKWADNDLTRDLDTYHLNKTELCEEKNIQLFHIFENEWLYKKPIWKSVLNSKMNNTDRIYARKTEIKEVSAKTARTFCEQNHLQGYTNSSIKIGLYYDNELISLMTLGKARFKSKYEYEIIRMCSKLNTTVVGGSSKLLKYFERVYKPKSIISYANRRWSQGNVYEKLGFEFSHNTSPNFFYFKHNSYTLFPRHTYQKHKIINEEWYDKSVSHHQNIINRNLRIIYDSGNKVYIKFYNI